MVELAVTLSIMAIVIGWAVPGMAQWVRDVRVSVLTNAFLADLQLARSEAIRRGAPVAMCARMGPVCGANAGWEQGWLLFADVNDNARPDPGEEIIREAPAIPAGWSLKGNGPVSHYVSYHSLGQTKMVSGAFQAGTLTICPVSSAVVKVRKIIISGEILRG